MNTYKAHRQSINRKLKGTGAKLDKLKGLSPELLGQWLEEEGQQKNGLNY